MIDAKTLQNFLKTAGFYTGAVDGIFGPASHTASRKMLAANGVSASVWPDTRVFIAIQQLFLTKTGFRTLTVDGISGPLTLKAFADYNDQHGGTTVGPVPTIWPRQKDVPSYFGAVGKNQVHVQCPYTLFGDYKRTIKVNSFLCHKLVAPSIARVLKRTLTYYGTDKIRRYNLDIWSGCLNVRKITGGTGYSMHSWGIAIDFDAAHNEFDEGRDKAAFAQPRYAPFLDFWEDEGWTSLGRSRNYDWMHVQAARLDR